MAKSNNEIFSDKVNLIYEYNKKSPLFVRAANSEIENNNAENAISILQEGIKLYPDYAAAYFLIGKAYTLLGNYSLALKNFKAGSDLIHSKKTYEYYLRELENIKRQRSLFDGNVKNAFLFETKESEIKNTSGFSSNSKNKKEAPVEDRLGDIAKKISSLPQRKSSEKDYGSDEGQYDIEDQLMNPSVESNLIVSETLAKIYSTQGEYGEAIEVYRKLIDKFPQKLEYYSKKINELQSRIDS